MSLEESNGLCLQRVNGKYLKQEGLLSHLSFTANWTRETRFKLAVRALLLTAVSWGSISIVYIAQDTIVLQVMEGIPVCFGGMGGGCSPSSLLPNVSFVAPLLLLPSDVITEGRLSGASVIDVQSNCERSSQFEISYYVLLPEVMVSFQVPAEGPIFRLPQIQTTYNAHPDVPTSNNGTLFPEISRRNINQKSRFHTIM
jgi:hypothetical protein